MSWQEELRKLDEELAAGQISADDYRVRRDQVLSSAVSSGPGQPAQPQHPQQEATQFIKPLPQPQQPPAARQPPPGEDNEADKTQIVPGDADRTQSVGPWQATRPGEADRTQVVPGVPRQTFAGGMPPRPAPGQGQYGYQPSPWRSDDLGSPWGGSDFPPLAPPANPDWIRQGPELFEGGRSKTGRRLLIVLAVVLVLAVAGGVLYLTVFRKTSNDAGSSPNQTSASRSQPPTSTKPPPVVYGPLRVPDGRSDGGKTYANPGEIEAAGALPSPDLILLKQANVTESRSVIVADGTTTMSLWSFTASDPQALQQKFTTDQQRFGFKETDGGVQGVQAYASTQQNANKPVYALRAHYVSGGKVIRVEAFDPDETKARDHFEAILRAQLEQSPPQ